MFPSKITLPNGYMFNNNNKNQTMQQEHKWFCIITIRT
jgi:hypothetical protein